jgi:Taurine catabolism dioxygenase TauD, TfdA family
MAPIRGSSRRAAATSGAHLVDRSHLPDFPAGPPLVLSPARAGVDLGMWLALHQSQVEEDVTSYGAVLFRGFELSGPQEFERVAAAAAGADLFGEYGDLPRESVSDKIFSSTPYPESLRIHFHNESSHMRSWPMRILFFSYVVAREGGATPILDCRKLCDALDPDLVDEFDQKGLLYTRNFSEGVDVAWQQFFGTADPAQVESACARTGTRCEWLDGGATLRTAQPAKAVRRHPVTGERVFFNQVLLHHPAALPADVRDALGILWGVPEAFPRNVTFGDGTAIPDSVICSLIEEFDRHAVSFPWRENDVIVLDNMLVSHGRAPYVPPRKVLVAMSRIIGPD